MRGKITIDDLRLRGACQSGTEWAEGVLRQDPDADLLLVAIEQGIWRYVHWAIDVGLVEPNDELRTTACRSALIALCYALDVDRAPNDETRTAACRAAATAYRYALFVDKAPRDDTRNAACQDAESAYYYARYVDCVPRD